MHRVLVIIVIYNAMRWIDRCLQSVRESSVRADVFIVDNGSTDGSVEYIRTHYPECRLHQSGENLGFGAANNIGLRHAVNEGYDFVYLLNQDAWLMKDTLERLMGAWKSEFGVLSPIQRSASGKLDPNFERKCGNRLNGELSEVPFVMAAHWLIGIDAVRRTGGFNPAFRHYGEDDNFIDRLHYKGLRCMVLKSAGAVHDREMRELSKVKRMALKCTGAKVRLMKPGRCWATSLSLFPLELIGMSIRNFSTEPLSCLFRTIPEFRRLHTLKTESEKDGAFL